MRPAVLAAVATLSVAALWMSITHAADSTLVERGRVLYTLRACEACHGPNVGPAPGRELPGTAALRERYGNSKPAVLADRTDLDPAYVTLIVRQGLHMMPYFRKTEVTDEDLKAIAAYLARNSHRSGA